MVRGIPNDKDDDEEYEPNVSYAGDREVYYYDIVGDSIRDAVTGARFPWKVGSFDEHRFYKVRSTTAYGNPKAKGVQDYCGRAARQAFYETPYSYMNHHAIILDEVVVKEWYDRIDVIYPGKYTYPGP